MNTFSPRVRRDDEIALIRNAADQAAPRRAQVVYIEGLAGVGKGTLLRDSSDDHADWRDVVVVLDQ